MPFDGFKFNTLLTGKQKKYILNKLPYAINETPYGQTWQKVVLNNEVEEALYFQIKNSWLNVRGSLPKIVHGNNYQNFTVADVNTSFIAIEDIFDIPIANYKIDNIEIGAMLMNPPIHSLKLSKSLLSYQNEPFVQMPKLSKQNASYGLKCETSNVIFKGYSKSLQENLNYDLFKFELRTKKMQFLQLKSPVVVYKPEDLLNVQFLQFIAKLIPKTYNSILKTEPITENDLTPKELELYLQSLNPNYFNQIKTIVSRSTYNRRKKDFKAIITKYSLHQIHTKVEQLLREQMLDLINQNEYNITHLNIKPTEPEKNTILPFSLIVTLFHSGKRFKPCTPVINETRYCLSCGKDISKQGVKSKYCSEKYVGKFKAKQCRNKSSGVQRTLNRKLNNFLMKGNSLFPEEELFSAEVIKQKYFSDCN